MHLPLWLSASMREVLACSLLRIAYGCRCVLTNKTEAELAKLGKLHTPGQVIKVLCDSIICSLSLECHS